MHNFVHYWIGDAGSFLQEKNLWSYQQGFMTLNSKPRHNVPTRKYLNHHALKRFKKRTCSWERPNNDKITAGWCRKKAATDVSKVSRDEAGVSRRLDSAPLCECSTGAEGSWQPMKAMPSPPRLSPRQSARVLCAAVRRGQGATRSTCAFSKETELLDLLCNVTG